MANINVKGFMMLAVGLIVSTILVTGVLVPVIGDAIEGDETTYTNTGDYQYRLIKDSSEEHTITVSSDGTNVTITTDGTTVYQHAITTLIDVPIIYGDNFVYMVNYDGEALNYTISKNFDFDNNGGYPIDANETVTLTIKNYMTGEMDGSDFYPDPSPMEFNEQEVRTLGYIVASDGDTILSNKPVVATNSPITAVGYTTNGVEIFPWGTGTIDDMKLSSFRQGTFEFDFTTTDVDGFSKIENMKITDTSDDSVLIDEITYFFVPVTVGIEGSGGLSPSMTAVLSLVPFLIIIGITLVTIDHMIKKE